MTNNKPKTNDEIKQKYWLYVGSAEKPDINGLLERMLNEARRSAIEEATAKLKELKDLIIEREIGSHDQGSGEGAIDEAIATLEKMI